jgi:hypothetical protein
MATWLAALMFAMAMQQAPAACPASPALGYVCSASHPEDIVQVPGTHWIISSGFSPGEGLKLVDADAKTATPFYVGAPEQIEADRTAYPMCPGPVDPTLFNARGLGLRTLGAGRFRLLVVNHGGRESIEVFDVTSGASTPTIKWRGCLPMPPGHVGNAVASFADGTVVTTVLTRPGTTITDFVEGRNTGGVWAWKPGAERFELLPGTELPGNNGLEVDPDGQRFYVVAFGWHAVLVFDRRDTRQPLRKIVMPDFMPDNVHWTDGKLVAAGMRLDEPACGGLRKIVNGEADRMLCHRGYVVASMDPQTGAVSTVAYGEPDALFNGVSSGIIVGDTLWLGSYQADRLAYRPLHRP